MSAAGSTVSIEYDGQDITGYVLYSETRFSTSSAATPGTAIIRVKDPNRELSFTAGKEVTLTVDDVLLWGGYVMAIDFIHAFPAGDTDPLSSYKNRMFELKCVDYNILFDKRVIRWVDHYTEQIPISGGATSYDGEALHELLSSYIDVPGGFNYELVSNGGEIENIATVLPAGSTLSPVFKQQGTKLREQFETFALFTAGVWYISPDKKFHWHSLENSVNRWGFSDVPNFSPIAGGTFFQDAWYPFFDVSATEDGTLLINDALVWGGSPLGSGGTIVFAREEGTTIAERGRWQVSETYFNGEPGMGIQEGVDLRAEAIVNGPPGGTAEKQLKGYQNSQWQFRLSWWAHDVPYLSGVRDHIVVGKLITIEMQTFFGQDAELLLPCRNLEISFEALDADGEAIVKFTGDFALNLDDPVRLWAFIKKRLRTISTSQVAVAGDDTTVYGAFAQSVPTPTPDGSTTAFYLTFGYISGLINVYLNGLLQRPFIDYTESDNVNGEFTMSSAPVTGDKLYCTYRTLSE